MPTTVTVPDDLVALQTQIDDLQQQINSIPVGGGGGSAVQPIFYDVPPPIESITQIAPTTGNPYHFHVIAQINIGPMTMGEHLWSFGSFAMTHEQGYWMQSTGFLRLHDGQGPTNAKVEYPVMYDTWPGQHISQPWSENWNNQVHHKICPSTGLIRLDRDYTDAWVSLIGYAASMNWQPGHTVWVDQNYGNLAVLRYPIGAIA